MTCVELLALVSDYLDGTIAPDARAILERHASDCDPCLALIETIKRLRANPDAQLSVPTSVHLQPAREEPEADGDNDEILDIFLEEGDDLLEAMEAAVGRWEANREDGSAIDELLRILHTLKGGARLAGQKRLGDMSHDLEQHLSEALQQGAPWPESLLIDLQSGFEGLQKELDLLRQRLSASLAEPPLVRSAPRAPLRGVSAAGP